MKLSGSPPGDLVRTLSRALDALRQLGNLPYTPVRRNDISNNNIPRGIHPDIRRSCREAAKAINRYPLKDRFSLEGDDDDDDDEMDIYSEDTNDVGEQ